DLVGTALSNFAGDTSLLEGTSIWKDKLGQSVASESLTIRIDPFDERIVGGQRFTGEGFPAEGYTMIEKGVLQSFMTSLYVANKTGLPRAKNSSSSMIIKAGDKSLDEIIGETEKGIIVARFSGGAPSVNGDFSGVAKNCFLVENGKIGPALSETMISGNLAEMLKNILAISSELVCDGMSVMPYMAFSGITISGK
ncbi:MAG: TldD/PmbA family protein, partial [Christensenellaceae bacterium]|nr:TldD/PmbA family protein [Christensenellaceae bacterium]